MESTLDNVFVTIKQGSNKGILEDHYPIIVQQSNTGDRYDGGGLAGSINKKFIEFREKKGRLSKDERLALYGKCEIIGVKSGDKDRFVVNLYGQYSGGNCKATGLDTKEERVKRFKMALDDFARELLDTANSHILRMARQHGITFPSRIGCGIGGGDWKDYSRLIYEFANDNKFYVQIITIGRSETEGEAKVFVP
jgi:O-acetyl-ADP-ribose deacetylase (regulator of RNase III)